MKIAIRELVKELLEKDYLIVGYIEFQDGGFDLSVRINEEKLNTAEKETDISYDKGVEDYLKKTCYAKDYASTLPNTNIPLTNNSCVGCDIYEEARKGKMVINDKCSFCSRNPLKITCGDTYDK